MVGKKRSNYNFGFALFLLTFGVFVLLAALYLPLNPRLKVYVLDIDRVLVRIIGGLLGFTMVALGIMGFMKVQNAASVPVSTINKNFTHFSVPNVQTKPSSSLRPPTAIERTSSTTDTSLRHRQLPGDSRRDPNRSTYGHTTLNDTSLNHSLNHSHQRSLAGHASPYSSSRTYSSRTPARSWTSPGAYDLHASLNYSQANTSIINKRDREPSTPSGIGHGRLGLSHTSHYASPTPGSTLRSPDHNKSFSSHRLGPHSHGFPSDDIPAYVTSYGTSGSSSTLHASVDKKDPQGDVETARAAAEFLRRKGIPEGLFDRWAENMRTWLSHKLVQTVVKEFADSEKHFQEVEASLAQRYPKLAMEDQDKKILFITMSHPNEALCIRRKRLEEYLQVEMFTGNTKDKNGGKPSDTVLNAYVLARLKVLAKTELQECKWERGSAWHGSNSAVFFPTDSQILVHVFFTYLKQQAGPYNLDRHFRDASVSARRIPVEKFCLAQTRGKPSPPYFMLEVYGTGKAHRKREEWRCYPGSMNVYFALVLFVYYIREKEGGRIGQCDFNKPKGTLPENSLIPFVLQGQL